MTSPTAGLKRSLTLPLLTLYGLGNILGAGIYVLVGKVAGEAGANTVLAFLIAMAIAGLTAFSYMELSSRFPQSASVSVYLHKAFKLQWLSVGIGVLLVLGGVASAAALAQGFAGYLDSIIAVPVLAAAVGLIIVMGLLASRGIAESAVFAAVITVIEVAGLLLIVVRGAPLLNASDITGGFVLDPAVGLGGVMIGAFLAFYAFIGFEDMVNVVEEVHQPRRTMPLAILLALVSATILYLLVVVISIGTTSPDRLAGSTAPLNLVLADLNLRQPGFDVPPAVISYIGLMATVNGVLVQIVMGSRILYGLAKQGWLPARLASVDPRRQTPRFATITVVAAMCVGTVMLSLVSLASITSFLVLTVFILVNLSLIVIKRRTHAEPRAFSVPIIVPLLACICCFGLIVYQLLS